LRYILACPTLTGISSRAGVAARAAVGHVGLQIDAAAVADRGAARTDTGTVNAASAGRASVAARAAVRRVGKCVDALTVAGCQAGLAANTAGAVGTDLVGGTVRADAAIPCDARPVAEPLTGPAAARSVRLADLGVGAIGVGAAVRLRYAYRAAELLTGPAPTAARAAGTFDAHLAGGTVRIEHAATAHAASSIGADLGVGAVRIGASSS
jgi:hypothetical protein